MAPEITAAFVAAAAAIIGAIIGAVVAVRTERNKLNIERERIQLELQKAQDERELLRAEVARHEAEIAKLAAETAEIRGKKASAERAEIRALLTLFERAAFRPGDGKNAGDPTAAFNGIRDTRIQLQERGAALIADASLSDQFRAIIDQLYWLEQDVAAQYPQVAELAAKYRCEPLGGSERLHDVRHALGAEQYDQAAVYIRARAYQPWDTANTIREALRDLEARVVDSTGK